MLLIARLYKVVLTVHDAVACVVPEAEKEEAYQKGFAEATKKFETDQATKQKETLQTLTNLIKK